MRSYYDHLATAVEDFLQTLAYFSWGFSKHAIKVGKPTEAQRDFVISFAAELTEMVGI